MIQNLVAGPPRMGISEPPPREAEKAGRERGDGSFDRTLEETMSSKRPLKGQGPPGPRAGPKETAERPREAPARQEKEIRPLKRAEAQEPAKVTTARQKAIQKFMDSFESEFGIDPTRLVEAMAQLTPSQLQQPPEVTAEAVIEALDLPDSQRELAESQYAGLLMELQKLDKAGLSSSTALATSEVPPWRGDLMKGRQQSALERRLDLNRSLDQLNQKFWMKDVSAAPGLQGPLDPQIKPSTQFERDLLGSDSFQDLELADETFFPTELLNEGNLPQEPLAAGQNAESEDGQIDPALQKLMQELRAAAQREKGERGSTEGRVSTAALGSEAHSQSALGREGMKNLKAESVTEAAGPLASKTMKNTDSSNLFQQQDSSGKKESNSEGGSRSEAGMKSLSSSLGGGAQPLRLEDVAAALKGALPVATAAAMTTPSAENETNIRQLMNQAQYLIKKGGGEMKVEMSPEHLGMVQLKVQVQDGKVNVQMATETSEAKKAIESSLAELRTSLAAQKLSMDHVKVDVVSAPQAESGARNESQGQGDLSRDQSRQFWNQFQESFGNRSFRDGMMELPSMKGYRQARGKDPLEPLSVDSSKPKSRASLEESKGRGLNLVA